MRLVLALWLSLLAVACGGGLPPDTVTAPIIVSGHRHFLIRTVDAEDDSPLAGVTLRTVNHITLVSDEEGRAAFYEPGLMGKDVYFFAERPGYKAEQDGFGFAGKVLRTFEGGRGTIRLHRTTRHVPDVRPGPDQDALLDHPVREDGDCFELLIRDDEDGRGVPLASVMVNDTVTYVSDSQGYIALCDPRFLNKRVRFSVRSHGYKTPRMHFNVRARVGSHAALDLTRVDIARRLYRVTGGGIYRDSVLLGKPTPLRHPLLNADVLGLDSVQSALFGGRAFFIYGDTLRVSHPLGNFHATGATARLPSRGGLPPNEGINLDYFVGDDGFVRSMAPPQGRKPPRVTWLGALSVVPDADGTPTMFAAYAHVNAHLQTLEHGLMRFAPTTERFNKALRVDLHAPMPHGHPTLVHHADGDYLYYQTPLRVPAKAEALLDPSTWETYTPFVERSRLLLRSREGVLEYAFRKHTPIADERELVAAGVPQRQRLMGHLRDPLTGQRIKAHLESSRAYNAYRGRYVELVQRVGPGPAPLSEIWYAEGDTPLGPFVHATRIASFDHYTFYNPRQHAFYDEDGGRRIYFEGTYTNQFTDAAPTPRYDYNQLMYQLDLTDPRLRLPVPVYLVREHGKPRLVTKADLPHDAGALAPYFFAFDRPGPGLVKVATVGADCDSTRLAVVPEDSGYPAAFYAYGEHPNLHGARVQPLRSALPQWPTPTEDEPAPRAITPSSPTIAYVVESDFDVALPVGDFGSPLTADAGADQCLRAGRDGTANVKLSGDAHRLQPREGVSSTFSWRIGGQEFSGAQVQVPLKAGDYPVELLVQSRQDTDTDHLVVHVE